MISKSLMTTSMITSNQNIASFDSITLQNTIQYIVVQQWWNLRHDENIWKPCNPTSITHADTTHLSMLCCIFSAPNILPQCDQPWTITHEHVHSWLIFMQTSDASHWPGAECPAAMSPKPCQESTMFGYSAGQFSQDASLFMDWVAIFAAESELCPCLVIHPKPTKI